MVNFPAPVGGTPFSSDFAPSLVFAILYGLLVPLMLYRMIDRRSRTLLLLGTVSFSVERVVIYSLRALQSRSEKHRVSNGLTTYMQISFGLGFIGIASDLVNIIRCVMVNPTYGSDMYFQSPAACTKGGIYDPPPPGTPDQPKLRKRCRDISGFLGLAFLAATVPGIIAQSNYSSTFGDQSKADKTAQLRLVSTIIALFLCIVMISLVAWSSRRFPGNSKRAAAVASGVSTLMVIVAIYRASVMHVRTTSLLAPDNPLNKTSAKAAFYIFHSLPEWLAIAILFYTNVRKLFGTGLGGDYRWQDMTPKEKTKWDKRQAKKEAKKKRKEGLNGSSGGIVEEIPLGEKGKRGFMGGHSTKKQELVSV